MFSLLERLVLSLTISVIKFFFSSLQSAYRRHHSTETAISKIYSDILKAADNGELFLLILLNLLLVSNLVNQNISLEK